MCLSGPSLFLFLTPQLRPPLLWQVQRPWEIQGSSGVMGMGSRMGVGVWSQDGRGALLLPVETDPLFPWVVCLPKNAWRGYITEGIFVTTVNICYYCELPVKVRG